MKNSILKDSTQMGDFIENGFLFVILKGGLLYLMPMLIILIYSAFIGWFNTKNDLTKAFSALILIQILGMFSFNLPMLTARYILVWIAVPICLSKQIRKLNNQTIKDFLSAN